MANEIRLIDANALLANEDLLIIIGAGDNICVDIADIAKAPTIDPESLRPKGKWKYYSTTMQECSACKRHTARHKYNYCPRCGAKMER